MKSDDRTKIFRAFSEGSRLHFNTGGKHAPTCAGFDEIGIRCFVQVTIPEDPKERDEAAAELRDGLKRTGCTGYFFVTEAFATLADPETKKLGERKEVLMGECYFPGDLMPTAFLWPIIRDAGKPARLGEQTVMMDGRVPIPGADYHSDGRFTNFLGIDRREGGAN